MALKKLNMFCYFDAEKFFSKLILVSIGKNTWREYETGNILGTKVELVIAGDKHDYDSKDGDVVSNIYEKIVVKIRKEIDVPMNSKVRLINPVGVVYGEYRNMLSITAENIEIIGK